MTDAEQIEVDKLTQKEMCELVRFAPSGHKYFTDSALSEYFMAEFKKKGGFTPALSKEIGWE